MLEYLGYKKYKKHKEEKAREEKAREDRIREEKGKALEEPPNEVLAPDDESFFEALISAEGPAPPLPPRSEIRWESTSDLRASTDNSTAARESGDDEGAAAAAAEEEGDKKAKKSRRNPLSMIPFLRKKDGDALSPAAVSPEEEAREERDITRVLSTLNLAACNDRAVSLTPDASALARRFTLIVKDLAAGVPTAYGDLIRLVEDRDGLLEKTFEKLPSGLQKLVMQMPDKMTQSIAPEVLAAAAKAQGVNVAAEAGMKEAAMSLLTARGLQEMVTKPGALAGMLKAIVNALKLRFPAFLGTNLLWSVAIFLLLFVLWYCHKRGKEERLKMEDSARQAREANDISAEEALDDPAGRLHGPTPVPLIMEPGDDPGEGSVRRRTTERVGAGN